MPREQDFDFIKGLVESTRAEQYPGSTGQIADSRALAHWGMRTILAAEEISHDRLRDATRIGGKNDCGVDGWHLDDDDQPILYLFQAKYGGVDADLTESELDELVQSCVKLLDPKREKNPEAALLAHDLYRLVKQGLLVQFNFVTTSDVGDTVRAYANNLSNQPMAFELDGEKHEVVVEFKLSGIAELREQYEALLRLGTTGSETDELSFASTNADQRFMEAEAPDVGSNASTLFFLAKGTEVAAIFNGPPKRWGLFKENPRGALQKRNSSIWKALQSPARRARFHALNNGLSIVCDDYTVSAKQDAVTLVNMRIVNGCQTTVTLGAGLAPAKGPPLVDDSVLVPVRVTKTSNVDFRKDVSLSTNTQRQVTAADMASLTDEMRAYRDLFHRLTPAYFFEIQAGSWDYMTAKEVKDTYAARIEREPLGQAVMAFKGKPGEALEDRRFIFLKKTGDGKGWFDEVFGSSIPVEEMLLMWKTYRLVQAVLKHAENDEGNPLNKPDYTRYSALVRTWLVSTLIGKHFSLDLAVANLPASISLNLAHKADDWFPTLYAAVNEAVYDGMEHLTGLYPEVEARNFFRQSHRQVEGRGKVPNEVFRERLSIQLGKPGAQQRVSDALAPAATA